MVYYTFPEYHGFLDYFCLSVLLDGSIDQLLHGEEIIAKPFRPRHHLPPPTWDVNDTLRFEVAPSLLHVSIHAPLLKPATQFPRVDIFIPIVSASGYDADDGGFSNELGGQEAERGSGDGGADNPAPWFQVRDT